MANALLLSLSGSGQVQPGYWLNPKVGIQYLVNARVPERAIDSLDAIAATLLSPSSAICLAEPAVSYQ